MQKNVLLTLTAEEKKEIQKFFERRLKTLDNDHLTDLQRLSQMSKQYVQRLQMDKMQFARSTSRAGQIMAKLHDIALIDFQHMIKALDQAVYQINVKTQKQNQGELSDEDQKAEALVLTCTEDELKQATNYLNEQIEKLRVPELKVFRDTCQIILSWWESERGQTESLHVDQAGNVNSASGRLAIRQKREAFQRTAINPFKAFFRDLNTTYQRKAKESTAKARENTAQAQRKKN